MITNNEVIGLFFIGILLVVIWLYYLLQSQINKINDVLKRRNKNDK